MLNFLLCGSFHIERNNVRVCDVKILRSKNKNIKKIRMYYETSGNSNVISGNSSKSWFFFCFY